MEETLNPVTRVNKGSGSSHSVLIGFSIENLLDETIVNNRRDLDERSRDYCNNDDFLAYAVIVECL